MAILNFQKPDKIVLQKATEFEAQFEFKPLEPGYGVTIGNALRRVLLSSLEGFAIKSIKIEGVAHEFSTIKGISEDVTEIILNLKQVRFQKTVDNDLSEEKIHLLIKDKEEFTAGMIEQGTSSFRILNPDLFICTMDTSAQLDIELTVGKGRGYIPAEEQEIEDEAVGTIAIDSIYTPIKKVQYHIDNTRVEQKTDYEKLTIEVSTDGTIHPEDAIKEAARILIQHLMIITDENINLDLGKEEKEDVVDEKTLQMRKILKTPLEDLDLSVRAFNCLKAAKINYLSELVQYSKDELLKFRNFGQKSLTEIEEIISNRDLELGMDVEKYRLDEE